ncbi:MAG: four helix bundle protein [Planctomycetes bacterium RBG_16_55_9]|nr:MAG: four helix bundle protein [Planctomycetes bacterium RBG_16_55_9]
MTKIKTYRDLIVWQKSMALVTEIYKITKAFPKDEMYGLIAQMRRCAVSIPSNIAEGYGRKSRSDYVRFLRIAMGSIYELQTQLEISLNLKYIKTDDFKRLCEMSREVERMLSSMTRKLNVRDPN